MALPAGQFRGIIQLFGATRASHVGELARLCSAARPASARARLLSWLDRMVANREAARRSLQKEFRRKAEKDVAAPSIVPESEKRVAKPEET